MSRSVGSMRFRPSSPGLIRVNGIVGIIHHPKQSRDRRERNDSQSFYAHKGNVRLLTRAAQ
jgi:hypothetical protein